MGNIVQNPVVAQLQKIEIGGPVERCPLPPEVLGFRLDRIKEYGCQLGADIGFLAQQVFIEHRRRRPVVVPHIDQLAVIGLFPQRVMVDDDMDIPVFRKRVVAGTGLGVDHADYPELVEIEPIKRNGPDFQFLDHRPVFTTTDNATKGNGRIDVFADLQQIAQCKRRRQRIGIGIVMGNDQDLALPADKLADPAGKLFGIFHFS